MCGIAGEIGLSRDYRVNGQVIDQMTDALQHRGPDDRGTLIKDYVGLGHRRLSIIDLSAAGHQPMPNEDKSIWIVFNGEIYNHNDYAGKLKAKGHQFNSASDTEVIIHAYEEWGIEGCIERLNGMFAFCLYDSNKGKTYLVRDRLGIKPLYYSQQNQSILFGSELKAIVANPAFDPDINIESLSHYLTTFYTAAPDSILNGVSVLEPGHYIEIEGVNIKTKCFWDIQLTNQYIDWSEKQILEKFDHLLEESVKLNMVSDVPVGHLLSSGVDSNAILYYMSQMAENIHTFTVDSSVESFSEGNVANTMAKHFGTHHHNYVIQPEDVLTDMDMMIWSQDQLSGNSACIGTHFMFKSLNEHGIKVGLMGSGPDEMFGGYETYMADRYASKLRSPILKPFLKTLEFGMKFKKASFEFVSTDYKIRKLLEGLHFSPEKSHYWWRSILVDEEKSNLFRSGIVDKVPLDSFSAYERHYNKYSDKEASFLDRSLYADAKMFLCNNSFMLCDGASMGNSVEARPSIVNHDFVEFAFQLPENMKISQDNTLKYIMRKSMKNRLPDNFLALPKRGMNLPISFWIEKEMKDFVFDTLSASRTAKIGLFDQSYIDKLLKDHISHKRNNMYKIWNLVCFYKWHELLIEKKGFDLAN